MFEMFHNKKLTITYVINMLKDLENVNVIGRGK